MILIFWNHLPVIMKKKVNANSVFKQTTETQTQKNNPTKRTGHGSVFMGSRCLFEK